MSPMNLDVVRDELKVSVQSCCEHFSILFFMYLCPKKLFVSDTHRQNHHVLLAR